MLRYLDTYVIAINNFYTSCILSVNKPTLNHLEMLFSFKNKYQYTYLNTYIALYFRTPKLPENTHTTDGKKFPSPINARFPVS